MDRALVISSVALVIATVVLAWFTYRLWQETHAARRPRMVASLDLIAPNYGELRIVNAGRGAAIAVDITFAANGGEQRRWAESVVLPGEGVNFNLVSEADEELHPKAGVDLDTFVTDFARLDVFGAYEDVRGKNHRLQQTVDVETQWEEAKRAGRLAAYRGPLLPFYQLGEDIKKSLREIRDTAKSAERRRLG